MAGGFRIAVVGAGAVGGYYGARLAQAGEEVWFLARSDLEVLSETGWRVESVDGDFALHPVRACATAAEIGPVDLVIVAWKSTSNRFLAPTLAPLLHDKTTVLTLQNGLGNVEALASLVDPARVFGGLCFVCINRLAPGHLRHSAGGAVAVGAMQPPPDGRLGELVERLRRGWAGCRPVESLEHAQWTKLVWNVPFNGLAIAEGGLATDALLASPALESEVRALMVEVVAAAAARGHVLAPSLIEQQIQLTRGMGAYQPSSMIDYLEGREVELQAIWGEPIRRALAAGVKVPRMEALLERICARLNERRRTAGS